MGMIDKIKSAWNTAWSSDPDGFIPVAGGDSGHVRATGGDEKWLAISAYFACLRNISEDVAKLPLVTYRRIERGKERARNHYLYDMLRNNPHQSISSFALRETLTRYALGWGNGYAKINRNTDGTVRDIEPVHPQLVTVGVDDNGETYYKIFNTPTDEEIVLEKNMIHIHGLSSDGRRGISVAGLARETLEFAGMSQTYGTNLFKRGARPSGLLTTPEKLKPDTRIEMATAWDSAYGGGNTGKTAVLSNGITYQPISISPVDAQFLETRQFTVEEVARWFRMPLHKIQYLVRAQGWSTLDAQNADYLTDTLMPWLVRWEDELNRKLFPNDQEHFAEHMVTGLLRGDLASQASYYSTMFDKGILSINEIRERENLNPIEGGDVHYVPLNMTATEKSGDENAQ